MKKIVSLAFAGLLLAALLLTALLPDAGFSALENRVLAQRPAFSLRSVLSGKWMDDTEDWLSDQFPGRDFFVRAKATAEYLLGKRSIGGAYLGAGGQYFDAAYLTIDRAQWEKNLTYLKQFAQEHNAYFLPVYSAHTLYPERLPAFVTVDDERALLADLPAALHVIDPYDALQAHRGEPLYFRTDHHWTQQGAYLAYQTYCEALGFTPVTPAETIHSEQPFYGSLYSKAPIFGAQPDELELYAVDRTVSVVYDLDESTRTDGLYTLSALDAKDQYTAFLDGNHARVDITTDAGTGRTLVVLKDSYAHALVPLLANHYDAIVMLDLRYFNLPVSAVLDGYPDADLLLTYNLTWLSQDRNLYKLNH